MAAALRDLAILNYEDKVGVPDSAQAVGDDDARPALQQRGQGSLDDRLRARVYVARRLVEDEDARVCQDRPGEREQLALALAECSASLTQNRVVTVREGLDEVVGVDHAGRGLDLLAGRLR